MSDFVVDKVAVRQVFSEYFSFSCQFSFHRLLHTHHHLLSGAGTIGKLVAGVPSGLSLTPPQEIKKFFRNHRNLDEVRRKVTGQVSGNEKLGPSSVKINVHPY
jgi:hypothetical protein